MKSSKNYIVGDTLFVYCGRGIVEFSDKIYAICQTNVKEMLFIGFCGGVSENVEIGQINVPKYILALEQDSEKFSNEFPILDEEFSEKVSKKLNSLSKPHATTPFLYIESREFLRYLKNFNIWTVDMEVSAFARITKKFKKKAAAILIVVDKPLEGKTYYEKKSKEEKKKLEYAKKRVLDFLIKNFVSK